MNTRVSLVLMILFIVLGSFAFFDPLGTKQKEEEKQERAERVVWLKDTKLVGLTVTGKKSSAEMICASAEGCAYDSSGDWLLQKPAEDKADPSAVGTLAGTLLNLQPSEQVDFDSVPDPHEFGLDQPQATVEIRVKGRAEPYVLKFGKSAAVGPNIYVSLSSEPQRLYLVANYIPGMLDRDAFHWRSKRIFPGLEAAAITRIEWKTPRLDVRALKTAGKWRLEKPVAAAAGQVMIEGLVSTVAYANAKAIFAANRTEPAARKALAAKPLVEVQFSAGAAQKISLFPFGKKELLAVTGVEGPVFTVEAAAFERFQKGILEYRQRSLLEHEARAKIDEIIFQFPREKQSVHMKKNGEAWAIVGGDKPAGELSQARVNSFLDSLRDADFQASFSPRGSSAEAKSYQTLTPELELEVKGGGATLARQRFVIHARQAALTESEGEVKALGAGLLQFLPVRVSDFDVAANQTVVHTQSLGNPEKGARDGHNH